MGTQWSEVIAKKEHQCLYCLVHRDRSKPKTLRIRTGAIRELADGVFAKKRSDGALEIYISEE